MKQFLALLIVSLIYISLTVYLEIKYKRIFSPFNKSE